MTGVKEGLTSPIFPSILLAMAKDNFQIMFAKILLAVAGVLIVVTPVLPSFAFINPEIWRQVLLIAVGSILATVVVVRAVSGGKVSIHTNLLTLGLLAWSLVSILAAVFSVTPSKNLFSLGTYLPLAILLWSLLLNSFADNKALLARRLLILAGVVLAVGTIFAMVSPMGLVVSAARASFLFWGAVLVAAVVEFLDRGDGSASRRMTGSIWRVMGVIGGIIIFAAVAISVLGMAGLAPFKAHVAWMNDLGSSGSWAVATESLKVRPLFGIGKNNFLDAYTLSRSDPLNTYNNSGNEIFNVLTTTGLLGFVAFSLFLITMLVASFRSGNRLAQLLSLLIILWAAVAPFNSATFVLFLPLLLLSSGKGWTHEIKATTPVVKTVVGVLGLAVLFMIYLSLRLGAANVYFLTGVNATSLQSLYDNERQAVTLDPYNDAYRRTYSQNSLSIARIVSGNQNPTDKDQANVQSLLQTASNEAQKAVSIDPYNFLNWQSQAQIAEALMGVSSQATSSAATAYAQAITLDPLNPGLRFLQGNFYYNQRYYQDALQSFGAAVQLKSDSPDAHYGLANTLEALGQHQSALNELTVLENLIADKESDSYKKVAALKKAIEDALAAAAKPAATVPAKKK